MTYPGLLWEQFLATQMLAMGLAPSEWELWTDSMGTTQHGYGTPFVGADNRGSHAACAGSDDDHIVQRIVRHISSRDR